MGIGRGGTLDPLREDAVHVAASLIRTLVAER